MPEKLRMTHGCIKAVELELSMRGIESGSISNAIENWRCFSNESLLASVLLCH